MNAIVNVNGRISDGREAVISVFDHGFLYGEGVYETVRTYHQRLFLVERHLRRLRSSAGMLALGVPLTDAQLLERVDETIRHAKPLSPSGTEWYVRLLLTRGVGELTYDPAATPTPSVVIIVKPHVELADEIYTAGVGTAISAIVRNHPGTVNPMIKSNNLLNNALAMQEGLRRGVFEVILRNHRGELAEGSTSNIFVVKDGSVLTPPLTAGLLPGITRELVFEIGTRLGVAVREATLHDEDLYRAGEAFLTSSTREIVPIVRVDDASIGTGLPGPVTRRLHAELRNVARATPGRG